MAQGRGHTVVAGKTHCRRKRSEAIFINGAPDIAPLRW
jgi:hypothetical protein